MIRVLFMAAAALALLCQSGCALHGCPVQVPGQERSRWMVEVRMDGKRLFQGCCISLMGSDMDRLWVMDITGVTVLKAVFSQDGTEITGFMAETRRGRFMAEALHQALKGPCRGWCGKRSVWLGLFQVVDMVYKGCTGQRDERVVVIRPWFSSYEILLRQGMKEADGPAGLQELRAQ